MTDMMAKLGEYLAIRERQRADDVERALAALTPFERRLIREAAVMAYVRGMMAGRLDGRQGRETVTPKDSAIVAEVIKCCQGMSDLYPLLAAAASERQTHLIAEFRVRLETEEQP